MAEVSGKKGSGEKKPSRSNGSLTEGIRLYKLKRWDIALAELLSYWRQNTFVNVNIPNKSDSPIGIIPSWPAAKTYKDTFSIIKSNDGSRFCFLEAGEDITFIEPGSDYDVVGRNFVSVSSVYNYPAVIRELCPGVPDYAAVGLRNRDRK